MRKLPSGVWVAAAVVLTTAGVGRAGAQEVRWRNDYAAARKEATESGRPLLLDFGNEACIWCRKLDASTFRDRAIADLLNQRFVPVKVDTDRQEALARALAVQSLPTLVLASPDGKVLNRHEGFLDAGRMVKFLDRALADETAAPPSMPSTGPNPDGRASPADLLALVRKEHDARQCLECLVASDRLLAVAPGSPEAAEAERLAGQVVSNPTSWRRVVAEFDARLDALYPELNAALQR